MICKDPWCRLVRDISLKLTQCSCMRYSKTISSIGSISPRPDLRGVLLQTLGLGDICQQIAKYAIAINNLYQKHIYKSEGLPVLGPHNVGKRTFFGTYLCT